MPRVFRATARVVEELRHAIVNLELEPGANWTRRN